MRPALSTPSCGTPSHNNSRSEEGFQSQCLGHALLRKKWERRNRRKDRKLLPHTVCQFVYLTPGPQRALGLLPVRTTPMKAHPEKSRLPVEDTAAHLTRKKILPVQLLFNCYVISVSTEARAGQVPFYVSEGNPQGILASWTPGQWKGHESPHSVWA